MEKGLQNIDENSIRLGGKYIDILQSIFAKLIWIVKRGRPKIEPDISFLCIILTNSTKEDNAKLRRVLQYPKYTINDKMFMGTDSLNQWFTWVDATYGVHPNFESHTGSCMPFVYGMARYNSSKKKLNTKTSTKAEVVGVSDYLQQQN